MIRAGIWKPRTRPGSFEGIGEPALKWLSQACNEYQMPWCVEVANTRHAEQAMAAGASVLWIGARTTVNPFLVQEIAESLRGTAVPVMVKNPVNPDLQLWIGAIERVRATVGAPVAAIHRGFTAYSKSIFRNDPRWEIAIGLMRELPEIPVICDPSHIAGNTSLLAQVAQKAMDLNMRGLMIEVHPQPASALSDAQQQITPEQLTVLLNGLAIRQPDTIDPLYRHRLQELRSKVDELDDELVNLLGRRFELSDAIGAYKREHNVTILQLERWNEILERVSALSNQAGVDAAVIRAMFELIHQESIRRQTGIFNNQPSDSR
jgi:chorismate mutase